MVVTILLAHSHGDPARHCGLSTAGQNHLRSPPHTHSLDHCSPERCPANQLSNKNGLVGSGIPREGLRIERVDCTPLRPGDWRRGLVL